MPAMQTYGAGLGASISEEIAKLVARGKAREIATVAALPAGVPEVSISEAKKLFDPLLKKWWVWAIAGTVVVGGAYLVIRRRR
jgi:hypothetical protein